MLTTFRFTYLYIACNGNAWSGFYDINQLICMHSDLLYFEVLVLGLFFGPKFGKNAGSLNRS